MTWIILIVIILIIGSLVSEKSKNNEILEKYKEAEEADAALERRRCLLAEKRRSLEEKIRLSTEAALVDNRHVSVNDSNVSACENSHTTETTAIHQCVVDQGLSAEKLNFFDESAKEDPLTIRRDKIKKFVRDRGIDFVVHFTRIENIPSIIGSGLIGRESAISSGMVFWANDRYRYDNVNNAISTSISFPNYKMFYAVQCNNSSADWAVIKLRPEVLWELDCAFCSTNAASSSMTNTSIEDRKKFKSLQSMFDEHHNTKERCNLNIPDNFPTNPQAEVLILERVDSKYIMEVCINSRERVNNHVAMMHVINSCVNSIKFTRNAGFFTYRKDYAFWRK